MNQNTQQPEVPVIFADRLAGAVRRCGTPLIVGLDPLAALIGLNGVILLAYVIAVPANEIVIPSVQS